MLVGIAWILREHAVRTRVESLRPLTVGEVQPLFPAAARLEMCRLAAEVHVSATTLDLQFSLDQLPLAVRVAGLDRDPGWIPAAGRSLCFHFR